MSAIKTPQKAIESEFVCYYNGDELNERSDEFRSQLPRMTWASARRLRNAVGIEQVPDLIAMLESMKAEPYGPMMSVIINRTMIGWPDDPKDWAVFNELIDQIIDFLRREPGPQPT